jgi:hypothetical protein
LRLEHQRLAHGFKERSPSSIKPLAVLADPKPVWQKVADRHTGGSAFRVFLSGPDHDAIAGCETLKSGCRIDQGDLADGMGSLA